MSTLGITTDEVTDLAGRVAEDGWRRGIEDFLNALPPRRGDDLRLSLNYAHTGWMGLLTGGRSEHAIGIDPGLGSMLIALSRRFRRVTAFYRDPGLIDIVQARLDWLGITNVALARSWCEHGVGAAPDGSIDAIAIYTANPAGLSAPAVNLYGRALRRDGALYVGVQTEAGGRSLASAVALRARLKRTFKAVSWYRQYHGLTLRDDLTHVDAAGRTWWWRGRAVIGTVRAPAFALVARPDPEPSISETVLTSIGGASAPTTDRIGPVISRYAMTLHGGAVIVAQAGERKVIVRMPFSPEMLARCERNARMLRRLEQLHVTGVPRLIATSAAGSQPFSAESAVTGTQISAEMLQSSDFRKRAMDAAVQWIAALHAATAVPCVLEPDNLRRLVLEPFDRAASVCHPRTAADVAIVRAYLTDALRGQRLPLVLSHGDFSIDNMMLEADGSATRGVFDWDCAGEQTLPLMDLVYLLFTMERLRRRERSIGNMYRDHLFTLEFDAAETAAIDCYCARVGVNRSLLLPLMVMMWAHHALRMRHEEWYPTAASSEAIVGAPLRAAASAVQRSVQFPMSVETAEMV